ncbi:MAG: hypothetical protein WCP11_00090 [Candidatus Saccharibacteria bacterium]
MNEQTPREFEGFENEHDNETVVLDPFAISGERGSIDALKKIRAIENADPKDRNTALEDEHDDYLLELSKAKPVVASSVEEVSQKKEYKMTYSNLEKISDKQGCSVGTLLLEYGLTMDDIDLDN